MRIVIMTEGSRGDVQPYIALGLGLQRAGHEVRLLTHDIFAPLIAEYGLAFAPLSGNPREILESKEGQRFIDSGENLLSFARGMLAVRREQEELQMKDAQRLLPGADLLLYTTFCFSGSYVAEALHIPSIFAALQPVIPTRAFPYPIGRYVELGGFGNYLSHILGNFVIWQMMRPIMQPLRRQLGLEPIPLTGSISWLLRMQQPVLLGHSSLVVPRPADWPAQVHNTGYLFLDAPPNWQAPADLLDFLQAGPPPVYIGFGSMANRKAEETTEIVLKALARARQRGIIATGWGGLHNRDLPDTVFKIEEVPHDWLFPRMAAVVHHAGSGTTAAALRAGVPSVPVPFFVDQPFWAARIHRLGVATPPIPRQKLTVERLARAIESAVSDQALHRRAAALAERIRAEDGVAQAVRLVHETLAVHNVAPTPC